MHKLLLVILCSCFVIPAHAQRATDTFSLYFDLGVPKLNNKEKKKIDLLIYNDKIVTGSHVMIVGYTDYLGTEGYNQNLSIQRAQNVKDYLVKYGLNAEDIKMCVGKGEVHRQGMTDKTGYPSDRRVDIVVNNKIKRNESDGNLTDSKKPKKPVNEKAAISSIEDLKKLKPGSVFLLQYVYFPPDRHVIKPESVGTLEKLYHVLKDNPSIKISIEGHVCCISPEADDAWDIDTHEATLSLNRAKEIYNYLVNKGIDRQRLQYMGFGKKRPVVVNEITEDDAEKNRRVEIRIIENK